MKNEKLYSTDQSFIERIDQFMFNEVVNEAGMTLDSETRSIAIISSMVGSQSLANFQDLLPSFLDEGLNPLVIKEVIYQAMAYLGVSRVYPFLLTTNQIFEAKGIKLPLEDQSTTTLETRLEKGVEAQIKIFGPQMKDFYKASHINRWLAANCFGDYYTRKGLDLKQRELCTFCYLASQGGAESQLTSHAIGNFIVGNDKTTLMKVVSQILPYIGYPRSLNAITCINNAEKTMQAQLSK